MKSATSNQSGVAYTFKALSPKAAQTALRQVAQQERAIYKKAYDQSLNQFELLMSALLKNQTASGVNSLTGPRLTAWLWSKFGERIVRPKILRLVNRPWKKYAHARLVYSMDLRPNQITCYRYESGISSQLNQNCLTGQFTDEGFMAPIILAMLTKTYQGNVLELMAECLTVGKARFAANCKTRVKVLLPLVVSAYEFTDQGIIIKK